ncbi:hypothetical protein FHR21_002690 [Sphingopyxis panaciterrulae]|uniref:Uncharacterized protein n=1 Tax=Sphingopyxis panaciterrulae TaxID=462372 RepID=A0A7W9ER94_9SPHN|nr:hypothetical protein [Sphingopyxis panaciterrulae]
MRFGTEGFESGPPPAFTGNDGEDIALRTKQDRLKDAADAERDDEFVVFALVEIAARIIALHDHVQRQRARIDGLGFVHGSSPCEGRRLVFADVHPPSPSRLLTSPLPLPSRDPEFCGRVGHVRMG